MPPDPQYQTRVGRASRRRRARALPGALLGIVTAACGEATGPSGGTNVNVTITATRASGPVLGVSDDQLPVITCEFSLTAVATGLGEATWQDATLSFFAGVDRTVALDRFTIPAAEVQQAWGGASIAAGQSRQSGLGIQAGVPYAVGVDYRYRPSGSDGSKVASVTATCGPDIPTTAAPPAVTELTVAAPTTVQPGTAITVHYTASGEVGLWLTVVEFTGPCEVTQLFAEQLAPDVTRSVTIQVPSGCALGVPATVAVVAVDAALQEYARSWPASFTLVDITPPVVSARLVPRSGSLTEVLAGEYFERDSIELQLNATDNNDLRVIAWDVEPHGYRDSMTVAGPFAGDRVKIPLLTGWAGALQLRIWARDAAGLTSDTITSQPGAFVVGATVDRPTASTTVSGEIRDFVIDGKRDALYLMQTNENRIAVLPLATLAVSQLIETPTFATSIDLTPGGDSLLLAMPSSRALGIVDLRAASLEVTLVPIQSLDTERGQVPVYVRATSNGTAFLRLGGTTPATYQLLELDLSSGTEVLRTDAGDGGQVGTEMERSHDHTAIVLNGGPNEFQRYDAATDSFGARRSASIFSHRPTVDGDGSVIGIGQDLFDGSLQFLSRMRFPGCSTGCRSGSVPAALPPAGDDMYMGTARDGIVRSRVSDGTMVDRTLTDLVPTLVRISADGTLLVATNSLHGATSRLLVVDLR